MAARKWRQVLKVGDRVRNKLNRRVGIVDVVEDVGSQQYGLHYDEAPQDRHLTMVGRDGAQLSPELIEPE